MVLNTIKRSIICRILQDGMEENLLSHPSIRHYNDIGLFPLTHADLESCIRELIDGDVVLSYPSPSNRTRL